MLQNFKRILLSNNFLGWWLNLDACKKSRVTFWEYLSKSDFEKIWDFSWKKLLPWKSLPIEKRSHQSHSKIKWGFFLYQKDRKKPHPKRQSHQKNLWTLKIFKLSLMRQSRIPLNQISISHISTSSIFNKVISKIFSVFELCPHTAELLKFKTLKNSTDPIYHRSEERRMQLEALSAVFG